MDNLNISFFNKKYWIRRFNEQKNINGYFCSTHSDEVVSIHVHPMGTDQLLVLPEGERKVKHLEGHGNVKLNVSDIESQTKGDLLFYMNSWYECTSCQKHDQTFLSHYNYQFVQVPVDASGSTDVQNPPEIDPEKWFGGEFL